MNGLVKTVRGDISAEVGLEIATLILSVLPQFPTFVTFLLPRLILALDSLACRTRPLLSMDVDGKPTSETTWEREVGQKPEKKRRRYSHSFTRVVRPSLISLRMQ